ncbi:MAG TPA: magnesium transporter CorA family protein [Pseudonocardiaceae bacterium]|nr:magnesium transporter CorA family protein [Pseudonocardiaceae bacterium]
MTDTAVRAQPVGSGALAHTRAYRGDRIVGRDFPVHDIRAHVHERDAVVWLDLCDPDTEDLAAIADQLGLHELAVEDAVHEHQRPKFDRYATHEFISLYATSFDAPSGELRTSELAAFITDKVLVTVRKDDGFDIGAVMRHWDNAAELPGSPIMVLLHGLLDVVVDGHYQAVQDLDERIETLEDAVFDEQGPQDDVQRLSFQLRKSLVNLRRVVAPMRELLGAIMHRDQRLAGSELLPYFQDVYDHVLRTTEWADSLRDMISSIVDTRLALQSNRLNVISKKVTGWAAIIAVPTAITGFYGQNVPYPGFSAVSGEITSSGLIVLASLVLYVIFRRKDWL